MNKLSRTSNHDETNHDSNLASVDSAIIQEASSLLDFAPDPVINGGSNTEAFSSNQTNSAPLVDSQIDSLLTEPSSADPNAGGDEPDSHAENILLELGTNSPQDDLFDEPILNNVEQPPLQTSISELAIETAIEDNIPTSTVPPIIDSQESDLRDTPVTTAKVPSEVQSEQPQTLDAILEGGNRQQDSVASDNSDIMATDLPDESRDNQQLLEPTNSIDATSSVHVEAQTQPETNLPAEDTEMADAPISTTKISREREDDTETGPSAKRAKTVDGESKEILSAAVPKVEGESKAIVADREPITPYATKEILKIIKNQARKLPGMNFKGPVSKLWPQFADAYYAKVSNPTDLSAIEQKLTRGEYASLADFRAEVHLLADNALLFNGADHDITKGGFQLRDAILSKVATIPPAPASAPSKSSKKATKKAAPASDLGRRQSRTAATPQATAPVQTFPLDPDTNMPVIRRDSNLGEGARPKREIHPPNRELTYATSKPKNKKLSTELKFCEQLLAEVVKNKYQMFMNVFMQPVDPIALQIPQYTSIIKHPMDISTVQRKMEQGAYTTASKFATDMKLIYENCLKFNPEGNPVRQCGIQFKQLFQEQWAKKEQYIADNERAVQSPSGDSDEDSEEEEAEEPTLPAASIASLRLIEEQSKLITLMANKRTDPNIVKMQQDMVEFLQSKIQSQNDAIKAAKKGSRKRSAPKSTKKAPIKKATKKRGYMGTFEKEVISNGISELPAEISEQVVTLIRQDNPDINVSTVGHPMFCFSYLILFSRRTMARWSWILS